MSTINNLRDTLFDTLDKLQKGEIKPEEAKAINEIAQTIINTGKLEHDYLKLIVDNNKNVEKKVPVNSYFIGAEPVDKVMKEIEAKRKERYIHENEKD